MSVKYSHTQKGSPLLRVFAVFFALDITVLEVLVYVLGTRADNPLPPQQLLLIMVLIAAVPVVILGGMGVMMSALTVSIDETAVGLRFGGGLWRKRIPLQRVTDAEAVQNTWANGWGIRYIGKGCWLYNIAGLDAVDIHLDNGKSVRIGTDEPEKLAHAICKAIGKSSQ